MATDCLNDLTVVWDVPNIDLDKNKIINIEWGIEERSFVPSDRNQHWREHCWRSDAIPTATLCAYGLTAPISSRLNLLSVHSSESPISLSVKSKMKSNHTNVMELKNYRAIVRCRCYHIVVEWIPFQIEYLTSVPDDLATLKINATCLPDRNHDERCVGNDSDEFRIDCTEVTIVAAANNTDVRVTALFTRWQPVHMSKFGRSHASKP